MKIEIRQESSKDVKEIEEVVRAAFTSRNRNDPDEHHLVNKIRKTEAFIPGLSLVALEKDSVVGHVLLSKIMVEGNGEVVGSLALAPVSVAPSYQNKGIGAQMIRTVLKRAEEMGYESVIVLGHDAYYPRFGFRPASHWNIKAPFDVPDEAFMALELTDCGLDGVEGTVKYSEAFSE